MFIQRLFSIEIINIICYNQYYYKVKRKDLEMKNINGQNGGG